MNASHIVQFLHMIGASKIRIGTNGWVHCCCPLAAWNHAGGRDSSPSFGIAVDVQGHSGYKCFACQAEGALPDLVDFLRKKTGKDLSKVLLFVKLNDEVTVEALNNRVNKAAGSWQDRQMKIGGVSMAAGNPALKLEYQEEEINKPPPVTEDDLKNLPTEFPPEVLEYLTSPRIPVELRGPDDYTPRGLTLETLARFEVRWNPNASTEAIPGKRIITPIRDVEGRLVSLSGRAFYKWTKPKFLHSKPFPKVLYLYGEYQCTKGGTGILVEGQFDVQMLHQHGYTNTVAVMGSSIGPVQIEKLTRFFERVIYVRDGDHAGREAEERIRSALHARLPVMAVEVPDGYDPDDLTREELHNLLGEPPIQK